LIDTRARARVESGQTRDGRAGCLHTQRSSTGSARDARRSARTPMVDGRRVTVECACVVRNRTRWRGTCRVRDGRAYSRSFAQRTRATRTRCTTCAAPRRRVSPMVERLRYGGVTARSASRPCAEVRGTGARWTRRLRTRRDSRCNPALAVRAPRARARPDGKPSRRAPLRAGAPGR